MCQMSKKFSFCDHTSINSNTHTNRNVKSQMQKLKLFLFNSLSLSLIESFILSLGKSSMVEWFVDDQCWFAVEV